MSAGCLLGWGQDTGWPRPQTASLISASLLQETPPLPTSCRLAAHSDSEAPPRPPKAEPLGYGWDPGVPDVLLRGAAACQRSDTPPALLWGVGVASQKGPVKSC